MGNAVYENLPTAVREGFVFGGWFDSLAADARQATAGAALISQSEHTLFAKWSPDGSVDTSSTTVPCPSDSTSASPVTGI